VVRPILPVGTPTKQNGSTLLGTSYSCGAQRSTLQGAGNPGVSEHALEHVLEHSHIQPTSH
jgi:hypothetical protein